MGRATDWIDARLQAFFDAIFQQIMRWGVPKKTIRYVIWCAFTIVYLGSLKDWFVAGWAVIPGILLALLHLFVWGASIQMDRDNDEDAERKGAMSWADSDFRARNAKVIGWLYIGLGSPSYIAFCITGILAPTWDNDLYRIISGVFGLAGGYLCRTKQPPKATKRAPSALDGLRNFVPEG